MKEPIKLFVFGTLKEDSTLEMLAVKPTEKVPATLYGYYKSGLNIHEEKGASVTGFVLQVTPEELRRIDRYEGYPGGYDRISVNVDGEEVFAYKY